GIADGGARQHNQIGHVATIERQIYDALRLHNLADAGATRLDLRSVGLDNDLLGNRAHFQRGVHRWITVDLQYDARLNVPRESFLRDINLVGTQRKIRQNKCAIYATGGCAGNPGFGLRGFYTGPGDRGTARVSNGSM